MLSPEFRERPVLSRRTGRDCGDGAGPMFALTGREWKFVYEPHDGNKLFNRREDPHELDNRIDREPEVGERWREMLQVEIDRQRVKADRLRAGRRVPAPTIDPEVRRELEALGYMDAEPSEPAPPSP